MSLTTPGTIRRLQEALGTTAKQEPPARFSLLYDKVSRRDLLAHAYALAKQHAGAAGVDGETVETIETAGRERWLAAVQDALQTETYRPQPVRRVMSPKPAGGERPRGIPTIRDRVGQTAVLLILQPIFEADVDPPLRLLAWAPGVGGHPHGAPSLVCRTNGSGGCRRVAIRRHDPTRGVDAGPGAADQRSETSPIAETLAEDARGGAGQERRVAVHRRQASDARHPARRGHLAAAREPLHEPLPAGVPPGRVGAALGGRLVNDADDVVVWCRRGAAEILAQTRQWFQQMGLTLNEPKTRLCHGRREPFTFLGDTFGPQYDRKDGHWYLGAVPAKKAVPRVKGRIRQILRPANHAPWEQVRVELNTVLRGWAAYFSYGTRLMAYRAVDQSVSARVRHFLRRRHQVPTRGTTRVAAEVVFGDLGVCQLRRFPLGPPAPVSV